MMKLKSKLARNYLLVFTLLGITSPVLSWAASSSELLEKAVYSQETLGDLNRAIELYKQVVEQAQSNQATAAEALYRQAVCYQTIGNAVKATQLLTQLNTSFSNQPTWLAKSKQLLQKLEKEIMPLIPEPWGHSEVLHYSLVLPTGKQAGSITASIQATDNNGVAAWDIEHHIVGGNQLYTQTIAAKDGFLPLQSTTKSPQLGQSESRFTEKGITTLYNKTNNKPNTTQEKQFDAHQTVYENFQMTYYMRRLPLTEKFSTSKQVYSSLQNEIMLFDIKVDGHEPCQWQQQQLDCFKLSTKSTLAGMQVSEATFWITNDSHRYIVKSNSHGIDSHLLRLGANRIGAKTIYQYKNLGLQFTAGANRQLVDLSFQDETVEALFLLYDTSMSQVFGITVITPEKDDASTKMRIPSNKARSHVDNLKKKLSDFKLDTFEKQLSINGQPAARFVANFKRGKQQMLISRTYISYGDNLYYFTIRVNKAQYEQANRELSELIRSLVFI